MKPLVRSRAVWLPEEDARLMRMVRMQSKKHPRDHVMSASSVVASYVAKKLGRSVRSVQTRIAILVGVRCADCIARAHRRRRK